MALSCSGLSGQLSLIRLCGFCTNRITHGFYSRDVSYQSKLYLCRHFASSNIRPGVFKRYISPTLQRANAIYEGFLKRRFPKLYELHRISLEGCKLLFQDCRDVRQIKMKMVHGVKHDDLSYREMEKLREFRKNLIKVIPIMLICSPPFLNYLGILLMYFFPRQVLIPYFWTPRQQVEFRQVYHSLRAQHYEPVLKELQYTSQQVKNSPLQGHLKDLCAKVQSGANPQVSEVLAVRSLFSEAALGLQQMSVHHMRRISPLLFLTPYLPEFLIAQRLSFHALELLQLDRALCRLGHDQLSDSELKHACYLRGVSSDDLDIDQCREWLSRWLQVSSSLKETEVSLLVHCVAFLSANYPKAPSSQTGSLTTTTL